jgi:hypothetical protein
MYTNFANWCNNNQGVVDVLIFLVALLLGWISGLFSALIKRPKLKTRLLPGPTFYAKFDLEQTCEGHPLHRVALALYLEIVNVGAAPTSIDAVHVGYHCSAKPFSYFWFKYVVGWFWLTHQTTALRDFTSKIGEDTKLYPFLFQKNFLSGSSTETFLDIGQKTSGIVYFEQSDSWGIFFPVSVSGKTLIKIRLIDSFGHKHDSRYWISEVSIEHAQTFSPAFGRTLLQLRATEQA